MARPVWLPSFLQCALPRVFTCTCQQVPPLHLLLGLRWHGLQDSIVAAVYLTYTLFAGVLVYYLYSLSGFGEYKHLLPSNWQLLQWRNYVVAPVTEEFCFRACMVPMLRLAVRPGTHACTHFRMED